MAKSSELLCWQIRRQSWAPGMLCWQSATACSIALQLQALSVCLAGTKVEACVTPLAAANLARCGTVTACSADTWHRCAGRGMAKWAGDEALMLNLKTPLSSHRACITVSLAQKWCNWVNLIKWDCNLKGSRVDWSWVQSWVKLLSKHMEVSLLLSHHSYGPMQVLGWCLPMDHLWGWWPTPFAQPTSSTLFPLFAQEKEDRNLFPCPSFLPLPKGLLCLFFQSF